MASILRMPAATAPSDLILKCQISAVFFTWVPPQSSMDCPKRMVLTASPYFSPKRAIAPCSKAFSMGTLRCSSKGRPLLMRAFTKLSIDVSSSVLSLAKWEKSKRRYLECTAEPFCSTWVPRISRSAWCNKCVAVWLHSVLLRCFASTTALNLPPVSLGKFFAKWTISLFSFLVSNIYTTSPLGASKYPLSPTCPPPSG